MRWSGGRLRHHEWERHLKGGWHIRHTVLAGADLMFSTGRKPHCRRQVWELMSLETAGKHRAQRLGFQLPSGQFLGKHLNSVSSSTESPKAAFQIVSFNPSMLAHFTTLPLPRQTRKVLFLLALLYT